MRCSIFYTPLNGDHTGLQLRERFKMDETFENTVETTTEDFNYETEDTSNGGSGLVGALIGGAVVAVGAAAVNAIKRNERVQAFVEAKKAARQEKAHKKWVKAGVRQGFIPETELETETK